MSGGTGNILESVSKIGLGIVAPETVPFIAAESGAENIANGGNPLTAIASTGLGLAGGSSGIGSMFGDAAQALPAADSSIFQGPQLTSAADSSIFQGPQLASGADSGLIKGPQLASNAVDVSSPPTIPQTNPYASQLTQAQQQYPVGTGTDASLAAQSGDSTTRQIGQGVNAINPQGTLAGKDATIKDAADKGFWGSLNNWQKAGIIGAGGLGAYALISADNKRFGTPAGGGQGSAYIRPYNYSKTVNPNYGGVGQPYFSSQNMTASTPINAYNYGATVPGMASGGIVAMADGGNTARYTAPTNTISQAVQDYNNMLAQRAQEEYVNQPQLGVMTPRAVGAGNAGIGQAPQAPNMIPTAAQTPAQTPANNLANPYGDLASTQAWQQQAGGDRGANGGIIRVKKYAMGGGIGGYTPSPDDGQAAGVHPVDTNIIGAHPSVSMGPSYPMQGITSSFAGGGSTYNLGSYSDGGRLLKGPGDGVSDDIPAQIGQHQPARLADGEFVIPARIVSELGNGSTDAGAKRLYKMMSKIQEGRKKSIGKDKVATDSKAYKHLPS
jgi:hypothetical protein